MRAIRRARLSVGLLLAGTLLFLLGPSAARVAPGRAPDVSLLFTGDVAGYIEPCG